MERMLRQISYFGDCKTLGGVGSRMRMKITMVMVILSVACSLFVQSSKAEMLYELTRTRDEMVQMAGYGEEKLSTVLVTGTVLCEACLHHAQQPLPAWPISGAVVAVKCQTACKKKSSSAQAITDEYGDFLIDLPSHLHSNPDLHKICQVKVLRIPKKSMCRPALVKKHKRLKLSSVGNGIRTYSAGKIRFQHITSKPLRACIRSARSSQIAKIE